MKTDIYTLLGMIKDDKAPKKIMYDNGIWNYRKRTDMEDTILYVEYINEKTCCDLFDEYLITDILNDEVTILETTITYKPDKIEKLNDILRVDDLEPPYDSNLTKIWCQTIKNHNKINEIIDRVNTND